MSYRLTGITLETNVTPESMETLNEVWKDIVSGKLPLMYDTDGNFIEGLSPITEFRNMTFEESQEYPIHIRTVNPNFFAILEAQTAAGMYKKYEGEDDSDIDAAADEVWDAIEADAKAGILDGTNLSGFESTVPPEYTPDHKAHSIVYIRTDK